jgi:putative PIN family toxin of toxin-antitoxin system
MMSTDANTLCKLVLDSNVWLDLLVFDDLAVDSLKIAMMNRQVAVWMDARCYAELVKVLAYPQFAGRDNMQALAWVRAHSYVCDKPSDSQVVPSLPLCSDHDDQKFIELVYHCQAQFLITKDKALLKLSRQMQRKFGIAVLKPDVFCAMILPKM